MLIDFFYVFICVFFFGDFFGLTRFITFSVSTHDWHVPDIIAILINLFSQGAYRRYLDGGHKFQGSDFFREAPGKFQYSSITVEVCF